MKISGRNSRKAFNRLTSSSTRRGHEMTCSKREGTVAALGSTELTNYAERNSKGL